MAKFAPYKVILGNLPDGDYHQDFVLDTAFFKNMENTDVVESDVKVHMQMKHRNGIFDCNFVLKGVIRIPCDRCLDPMDHAVDTTYHIAVKYGEEYDDSSDDVLVIPQTDMSLNVAYMLYDTVLLTIPMRHVHPAGKCNKAMLGALRMHRSAAAKSREEALDEMAQEGIDTDSLMEGLEACDSSLPDDPEID